MSERLLNMSIEVLYLPPKLLYPQNKFLATPLEVPPPHPRQIPGYTCWE